MVKQAQKDTLLAKSFSGLFNVYLTPNHPKKMDKLYIVYKVNLPDELGGFPVAFVSAIDGSVTGIQGNTGNRFDRLESIQKADIGTAVNRLMEDGYVARLGWAEL